jgi:hypothetical protein
MFLYLYAMCGLPKVGMQELACVAEDVEGGGLLPPPGEDPLHQLPHTLPRHRRQDRRRLVGQDQPARALGPLNR